MTKYKVSLTRIFVRTYQGHGEEEVGRRNIEIEIEAENEKDAHYIFKRDFQLRNDILHSIEETNYVAALTEKQFKECCIKKGVTYSIALWNIYVDKLWESIDNTMTRGYTLPN